MPQVSTFTSTGVVSLLEHAFLANHRNASPNDSYVIFILK